MDYWEGNYFASPFLSNLYHKCIIYIFKASFSSRNKIKALAYDMMMVVKLIMSMMMRVCQPVKT